MLQIYNNSVKFLDTHSSKLTKEDPILVHNSLSELLKGVGNLVSSAVFTRSKDYSNSKVGILGYNLVATYKVGT